MPYYWAKLTIKPSPAGYTIELEKPVLATNGVEATKWLRKYVIRHYKTLFEKLVSDGEIELKPLKAEDTLEYHYPEIIPLNSEQQKKAEST